MKRRPLTLIEVLQPRPIKAAPERARVTRTVIQPEVDSFEMLEAARTKGGEKSALTGRRAAAMEPHLIGA